MNDSKDAYHFWELIDAISKRPRMFTVAGTLDEADAYIEGFAQGVGIGGRYDISEWIEFSREWLPRKLQYPMNYGWPPQLLRRCRDDQEALKQLRLLYQEYLTERNARGESG